MESFYHGKPLENIGIVKQMGVFNPLKLGTLCTKVPHFVPHYPPPAFRLPARRFIGY
jgi:hypothetical protein